MLGVNRYHVAATCIGDQEPQWQPRLVTCGLQAMQEAAKHLAKSRATDREAQVAALQEASDRISRFVQANSLMVQDPAAGVTLCQQLLQEAPEQMVRLSYGRPHTLGWGSVCAAANTTGAVCAGS